MTKNRLIMTKRSPVLCLLVISGFSFFTVGSSPFHLIDLQKSYEEAKSHCRDMYTDLATVRNFADMNDLNTVVSTSAVRAWIGLETGNEWKWHWTWPGRQLRYLNWRAGEPQIKNQDACAAMDRKGKWFERDCGSKISFVCHGVGESTGPTFVANSKSWRDAQNHCRNLSSDLVSISSAKENKAVRDVSLSQNVWIGLFKDRWRWSDGSSSSFRNWKPDQPNYREDQDCAVAVFKDKGQWNDLRCSGKRKFVCQGASKPTTAQTTTQETTTVRPSTTVTTTVSPTTTQTTTVDTTLSTALSNLTNIPGTTDDSSASTTLTGTSAQNTTQISNPASTETSPSSPAGEVILIQQNMTWIEAMSYCREHYMDLVHITTKAMQEKVAEKARNATSPHVWLGLRYTCHFDFWFWTKSTSGCYQNWAPGEGTDVEYGCDVTGAIQATGGQQWVGLPETEKLNFICSACPD